MRDMTMTETATKHRAIVSELQFIVNKRNLLTDGDGGCCLTEQEIASNNIHANAIKVGLYAFFVFSTLNFVMRLLFSCFAMHSSKSVDAISLLAYLFARFSLITY